MESLRTQALFDTIRNDSPFCVLLPQKCFRFS
jgi:hypothetical protein